MRNESEKKKSEYIRDKYSSSLMTRKLSQAHLLDWMCCDNRHLPKSQGFNQTHRHREQTPRESLSARNAQVFLRSVPSGVQCFSTCKGTRLQRAGQLSTLMVPTHFPAPGTPCLGSYEIWVHHGVDKFWSLLDGLWCGITFCCRHGFAYGNSMALSRKNTWAVPFCFRTSQEP